MLGAGLSPVLAAPKHKTSPEKLAAGLPVDCNYEEQREGAVSPPPLFSWEDKPPRLELFKNRVGIQPSTSALNSAASTVGGSLETQPQLQRSRIGLDVPPGLAEEDEAPEPAAAPAPAPAAASGKRRARAPRSAPKKPKPINPSGGRGLRDFQMSLHDAARLDREEEAKQRQLAGAMAEARFAAARGAADAARRDAEEAVRIETAWRQAEEARQAMAEAEEAKRRKFEAAAINTRIRQAAERKRYEAGLSNLLPPSPWPPASRANSIAAADAALAAADAVLAVAGTADADAGPADADAGSAAADAKAYTQRIAAEDAAWRAVEEAKREAAEAAARRDAAEAAEWEAAVAERREEAEAARRNLAEAEAAAAAPPPPRRRLPSQPSPRRPPR